MFAEIPAYGWVSELSSKFAERTAQRIKHVLRLSVSSPPGVSQPYHMSPHGSPPWASSRCFLTDNDGKECTYFMIHSGVSAGGVTWRLFGSGSICLPSQKINRDAGKRVRTFLPEL